MRPLPNSGDPHTTSQVCFAAGDLRVHQQICRTVSHYRETQKKKDKTNEG